MKKWVFVILWVLSIHVASAVEKEMQSEIKEVTVFQQGAQIYRTGSTLLKSGVTDVILTDLSKNINQQSIQVKGFGNFTILSVNYQLNYLRAQKSSKEIKMLEDSLDLLKYKEKDLTNNLSIYNSEEKILMANQTVGGSQTGLNVEALKAVVNYVHSKLIEIKAKELKLNEELVNVREDINRIQNQLNTMRTKRKEPVSEVVVKVIANQDTKAVFDLKYVIGNAGWTPEYDLRATDITKPVTLNYKAKVSQSSGEDWNNVKLSISTGNPRISGVKPEMNPWYLDFYTPKQAYMYGSRKPMAKKEMAYAETVADYDEAELSESGGSYEYFETTTNQTNIEFKIDIPYTIPSNGKDFAVQVNKFELNADYTYYAAPKLQETAFLLARVTGWEQYNLLPGQASIFFEGTYVGNSTIDPSNTEDTLNLSLGRDEAIVVTRNKIKDFESKRLMGMNKKETFGYEIKIRNNKKSDISIIIEDQFPISSNKDIEIEQIEKTGARLNPVTGIVSWGLELKPSETRNLELKYSVKYPKDKKVNI